MIFAGKVAIVTGGSRGIGRAIVEAFCAQGAKVYFTYKSNEDLAKELAAKTGALALKCNQENPAEIEEVSDKIFANEGKIDILVNNAGITKDAMSLMMPEADWSAVINTNLNAAFFWSKNVAKKMYTQRSGSIIFISSVSGLIGISGQANYSASKAGMLALSRTFAAELGAKGIRVNSICPGFIDTDMTSKLPKDFVRNQKERISLKRFGKPEEIANVALFLASDAAAYITGQNIVADGGLSSVI